MIYVYIALGVLFLFLLLLSFVLFMPLTVRAYYDNTGDVFYLSLKYFGITFKLSPPKEKKKTEKKKKPKKKPKKKTKTDDKKQEDIISLKKLYEEYGFSGIIKLVESVFKAVFNILVGVFRKSTLNKLVINVKAVGEDAANTAILCGWAYSVICPVVSVFLDNVAKYKECSIDIVPDYSVDAEPYLEFELIVSIRIFSVMILCLRNGKVYFKLIKALLDSINH